MTRDEEAALIARARSGDQLAFEELYRAHWPRLRGACYRLTGNAADAEDCAGEAMACAFARLGQFDARARFGTWLFSIGTNVVAAHRRRRRRLCRRAEVLSLDARAADSGATLAELLGAPDAHTEGTLLRADLGRAIAALSPHQRLAFRLAILEGRSVADVAAAMHLSLAGAASAIHRLRLRLRASLARQELR